MTHQSLRDNEVSTSLRYAHGWLAAVHGLQGLAVCAATAAFDLPSVHIVVTRARREDGAIVPHDVGDLAVGYMCGAFLLLAALDHALVAGPMWSRLVFNLQRRYNPFRWAEYTFSLPLMSIVILALCGGADLWMLQFGALLSGITIGCGWIDEAYGGVPLVAALGWIPFAFLWALKATLVAMAGGNVPAFVWVILVVLFLLECLFGVVPFWGRVRPYAHVEAAFCALSLLSKSSLAWITFGGVLSLRSHT